MNVQMFSSHYNHTWKLEMKILLTFVQELPDAKLLLQTPEKESNKFVNDNNGVVFKLISHLTIKLNMNSV
jgi:hypothetical protein